jgi:hypothetical protein
MTSRRAQHRVYGNTYELQSRVNSGAGIKQLLMQIRFGAHEGPSCPACKRLMNVMRRTPHPVYGHAYELQTFECRTCKFETERSADRSGLPHSSDGATLP